MISARVTAVLAAFTLCAVPAVDSARTSTKPYPAAVPATAVGPWNVVADDINANVQSGDFSIPGHFQMTRADGSTVDADRAVGNYKRKRAHLYGHVVMHDAAGTLGGLSSARKTSGEAATLRSDELAIDGIRKIYTATGSVHYAQGPSTADADNAKLNDKTHRLNLTGNVHIVRADRTLDSQSAVYNTVSGDGEATGKVRMVFPSAIHPTLATPKPIVIKNPKIP
ncbi:MAG: LPS export ABC transporter periplasmic protein LptC [Candidatus Eremiobacteraeota bacterium]|nr:LPS export ABC transporter periplasmic protein LptC [Candidatus Eremiobacteraeota bacterium]